MGALALELKRQQQKKGKTRKNSFFLLLLLLLLSFSSQVSTRGHGHRSLFFLFQSATAEYIYLCIYRYKACPTRWKRTRPRFLLLLFFSPYFSVRLERGGESFRKLNESYKSAAIHQVLFVGSWPPRSISTTAFVSFSARSCAIC